MNKNKDAEQVLALKRGINIDSLLAELKQGVFYFLEILFISAFPLRIASYFFLRVFLFIFFRHEIKGRDNLAELNSTGAIFVANHHTKFDPFIVGSCIPWSYYKKIKHFRYFTYWKQMTRRPYGPILWLYGSYPVYQYKGNYERSLNSTISRLLDNQSILIFPTAHLEKVFTPANARPGVAYVAREIDPPIVPVRISNHYKFNPLVAFLGFYRSRIIFGRPFRWREVAGETDDLPARARKIMEKVAELEE